MIFLSKTKHSTDTKQENGSNYLLEFVELAALTLVVTVSSVNSRVTKSKHILFMFSRLEGGIPPAYLSFFSFLPSVPQDICIWYPCNIICTVVQCADTRVIELYNIRIFNSVKCWQLLLYKGCSIHCNSDYI